jgi:hypothetical protein
LIIFIAKLSVILSSVSSSFLIYINSIHELL